MEKIKVGIIGAGSISNEHIQGYLSDPRAELYALCDINEERLREMGKKYGVTRLFTDKADLLALPEIDAVSVCTWNSQHAPCSIAALEAGKNVLCEKPMAMNADEARRMKEAAQKSGKLLMIGFVRRFGNDCRILQDFINAGSFGDIYYAKASYLRRKGSPGGWFGDQSRSGGGPLIDLGVHVIDLARYLMGNPKPVSVFGVVSHQLGDRSGVKDQVEYRASSATDQDVFDVEDFAAAMIRFDNGAVLSVETSYSLNIGKNEGKIELFGTKAGAKIDPEVQIFNETNGYMTDLKLAMPSGLSMEGLFKQETAHFLSCVQEGAPCKAPAEDGIELMRILDAVYESGRTGHEVAL